MKRVLLLTDFSENSKNAIDYALNLLKDQSCEFFLMNVHKMGSFTTDNLMLSAGSNIYDSIVKEPSKKLKKLVSEYIDSYKNSKHTFETIVDFDNFSDAVNQVVESKEIDLVVIGTNGKTGAQEVVFGSNTLNVIRKVYCNTLIIPEKYTYKTLRTVLLPLNSKDTLHENSIEDLEEILLEYNLNLNVLRINPDHSHPEYTLFDRSNLENLKYDYYLINNVPVHYAVNSFIQIKNIDIVVILVKDEGFFDRLFSGSAITKLSNSLKLPMFVLHND